MNDTGNCTPDYSEAARETAYLGLAEAPGTAPGERDVLERGPRATFWEALENDHGRQGAAAAIAGCADAAQAQAEHGSLGPDAVYITMNADPPHPPRTLADYEHLAGPEAGT